jgi:hypothetical protein
VTLPGVGTWATIDLDGTQIRAVPRLDGSHDLIEVRTDPAETCVWPSVDLHADLRLSSATLTFTEPATCSTGAGGSADVTISWRATGSYQVGLGGLQRPAEATLCQIADPNDCVTARGAIGLGTLL